MRAKFFWFSFVFSFILAVRQMRFTSWWYVTNGHFHIIWDPFNKITAIFILNIQNLCINFFHWHCTYCCGDTHKWRPIDQHTMIVTGLATCVCVCSNSCGLCACVSVFCWRWILNCIIVENKRNDEQSRQCIRTRTERLTSEDDGHS